MLWGTTSPPYSNESNPGHVAWVEAVSDDGSKVLVSQYNYNYGAGWGMYSEMWLSSNFFDQYVKIK
jgi:surface antigen